jgi:hypothetical protein
LYGRAPRKSNGYRDFTWRSRTSANAVDAYHIQREEKLAKSERVKEKKKKPKKEKPLL